MRVWLPKRFGLRTLFILVAICAVVALFASKWLRLQKANEHFERANAFFNAGALNISDLAKAADEIFEAESSTPWITHQAAAERQIARLTKVLERGEALLLNGIFSDEGESVQADCDQLREKIKRFTDSTR